MQSVEFGDRSQLAVFEHVPKDDPSRKFETPEREVSMMERLRGSVSSAQAGGIFRLTAIDSTHYPYHWGKDWQPPMSDYEKNPIFPPLPSDEEIQRVVHRYWNSVAWVDHLLEGFVVFLKQTGRYDDAMIVVTGDHGEEFKEHGSWFHCSGVNREQTNVPILIKWPSAWGRGPAQSDASHLDLVPTFLHALGFPETTWSRMPGRSLLKEGGSTSIVATQFAGDLREAMLWRRDGYEAAFSWDAPWEGKVPGRLWLERLQGPAGIITHDSPAEYEAGLRRLFPDAFARTFERCVRVEN
jgi:hypothetical protein